MNLESVSINGGPTIEFRVRGDVMDAELCGAKLHAELRHDGKCDLRLTDATGFVLADLIVNERTEVNMTENVRDVGSALLWSHWRYLQAKDAAVAP